MKCAYAGALAVFFTLALLVAPPRAEATSWQDVEVSCPLCPTTSTHSVPMSTYISSRGPDLRPRGVGIDFASASVVMCPQCGFATNYKRFSEGKGLDRERVRAALAQVDSSQHLFLKFDRALAVERAWSKNAHVLARLCLAAKWRADDTGEPALIRSRLDLAIRAHEVVLSDASLSPESRPWIQSLLAVLCRQAGRSKDALKWVERAGAEPKKPPRLAAELQRERLLAELAAATPAQVASRLAQEATLSPSTRAALLPLLLEGQGAAAIAEVRSAIYTAGRGEREDLRALFAPVARRHHLPLFLEAVKSRQARVRELGVAGLRGLPRGVALPALFALLESGELKTEQGPPPPKGEEPDLLSGDEAELGPDPAEANRELRRELLEALGGHLRSEDASRLLALIRPSDVEAGQFKLTILDCLLKTGNAVVVPQALKVALANREGLRYVHRSSLRGGSDLGPAFVDGLLKVASGEAEDPVLDLALRVLAAEDSPWVRERLRNLVGRGERTGFRAAIALAKRGDASGRDLLLANLANLERFESGDGEWDAEVGDLLPILRAKDYPALHVRWGRREAAWLAERRSIEAESEQSGLDPETRRMIRENNARLLNRLERKTRAARATWIQLLCGTGHPEARTLLEVSVDDEDASIQCAALRVAHLYYDARIRSLAERLLADGQTEARTLVALIEMGDRVRDAKLLPLLLALVEQPTHARFKYWWWKSLQAWAPAQAEQKLGVWVRSPNTRLATWAREELEKD